MSINPWVRADLERVNDDTYNLIPEADREEYLIIMNGLEAAGVVLNEAQSNYHQWQQRRAQFFSRVIQPPADEVDETGYPSNVIDFAKELAKRAIVDSPLADPRSIAREGEW